MTFRLFPDSCWSFQTRAYPQRLLTTCNAPRARGTARWLRRLLYLCAELDYLPTVLRGNPRHFPLKAVRDIKLDYLCHELLYCLPF